MTTMTSNALTSLASIVVFIMATTIHDVVGVDNDATTTTTGARSDDAAKLKHAPPKRRRMPYLRPNDLQDLMGGVNNDYDPKQAAEQNWMSVSEDVEFLPLLNKNNNRNNNKKKDDTKAKARRKMTRSLEEETTGAYADYDPYSVQPFVEGMSEYDEYQQAWRLLGFMIDCNTVNDDDYEASGGSGDSVTDEGCARYVLWAAYVDLEYEGGGIGEYQYWDRGTQQWNDTACLFGENGSGHSGDGDDDGGGDGSYSRCAKMDCHKEDVRLCILSSLVLAVVSTTSIF